MIHPYNVVGNSCNFESEKYCGQVEGLIDSMKIEHIYNNTYDMYITVFGNTKTCNNETLTCTQDNIINYPNLDKNDCLNKELNKYNLKVSMNYDSDENIIQINSNLANFDLTKC